MACPSPIPDKSLVIRWFRKSFACFPNFVYGLSITNYHLNSICWIGITNISWNIIRSIVDTLLWMFKHLNSTFVVIHRRWKSFFWDLEFFKINCACFFIKSEQAFTFAVLCKSTCVTTHRSLLHSCIKGITDSKSLKLIQ